MHPTGPLFRSPRGRAWLPPNLARTWQLVLSKKAVQDYLSSNGINPATVQPYNYRHTWLSNWVDDGRSLAIAAELCGTSANMIERVYGHPDADRMETHCRDFHAARYGQ
jgi:site-specific recombinase XerD